MRAWGHSCTSADRPETGRKITNCSSAYGLARVLDNGNVSVLFAACRKVLNVIKVFYNGCCVWMRVN